MSDARAQRKEVFKKMDRKKGRKKLTVDDIFKEKQAIEDAVKKEKSVRTENEFKQDVNAWFEKIRKYKFEGQQISEGDQRKFAAFCEEELKEKRVALGIDITVKRDLIFYFYRLHQKVLVKAPSSRLYSPIQTSTKKFSEAENKTVSIPKETCVREYILDLLLENMSVVSRQDKGLFYVLALDEFHTIIKLLEDQNENVKKYAQRNLPRLFNAFECYMNEVPDDKKGYAHYLLGLSYYYLKTMGIDGEGKPLDSSDAESYQSKALTQLEQAIQLDFAPAKAGLSKVRGEQIPEAEEKDNPMPSSTSSLSEVVASPSSSSSGSESVSTSVAVPSMSDGSSSEVVVDSLSTLSLSESATSLSSSSSSSESVSSSATSSSSSSSLPSSSSTTSTISAVPNTQATRAISPTTAQIRTMFSSAFASPISTQTASLTSQSAAALSSAPSVQPAQLTYRQVLDENKEAELPTRTPQTSDERKQVLEWIRDRIKNADLPVSTGGGKTVRLADGRKKTYPTGVATIYYKLEKLLKTLDRKNITLAEYKDALDCIYQNTEGKRKAGAISSWCCCFGGTRSDESAKFYSDLFTLNNFFKNSLSPYSAKAGQLTYREAVLNKIQSPIVPEQLPLIKVPETPNECKQVLEWVRDKIRDANLSVSKGGGKTVLLADKSEATYPTSAARIYTDIDNLLTRLEQENKAITREQYEEALGSIYENTLKKDKPGSLSWLYCFGGTRHDESAKLYKDLFTLQTYLSSKQRVEIAFPEHHESELVSSAMMDEYFEKPSQTVMPAKAGI